jgi:hypothetical protein
LCQSDSIAPGVPTDAAAGGRVGIDVVLLLTSKRRKAASDDFMIGGNVL